MNNYTPKKNHVIDDKTMHFHYSTYRRVALKNLAATMTDKIFSQKMIRSQLQGVINIVDKHYSKSRSEGFRVITKAYEEAAPSGKRTKLRLFAKYPQEYANPVEGVRLGLDNWRKTLLNDVDRIPPQGRIEKIVRKNIINMPSGRETGFMRSIHGKSSGHKIGKSVGSGE